MYSGIISNKEEEAIADFLINDGYGDLNVIPVTCILSGSRAYGLNLKDSDRDYQALHLMDTWQCLEHPKYRQNLQVIRKLYDADLNELTLFDKSDISLQSYELWKAIDLLVKGAFVIYELVYMPTIHHDTSSNYLISLFRECLTTKIGYAAIGTYYSDWKKRPTNRKKTIMTFYRLMQAIYFLREQEFQWNAQQIWDYMNQDIPAAKAQLKLYMDPQSRKKDLTGGEKYFVQKEMEMLVAETRKAIDESILPTQVPQNTLRQILNIVKTTRTKLI